MKRSVISIVAITCLFVVLGCSQETPVGVSKPFGDLGLAAGGGECHQNGPTCRESRCACRLSVRVTAAPTDDAGNVRWVDFEWTHRNRCRSCQGATHQKVVISNAGGVSVFESNLESSPATVDLEVRKIRVPPGGSIQVLCTGDCGHASGANALRVPARLPPPPKPKGD